MGILLIQLSLALFAGKKGPCDAEKITFVPRTVYGASYSVLFKMNDDSEEDSMLASASKITAALNDFVKKEGLENRVTVHSPNYSFASYSAKDVEAAKKVRAFLMSQKELEITSVAADADLKVDHGMRTERGPKSPAPGE